MPRDDNKPSLIVIAGPNGAGKSTLTAKIYQELIAHAILINPDDIAKNIELSFPQKSANQHKILAARQALKSYEDCFTRRKSFVIETTLAGNTPLKVMKRAREENYHVTLAYIGIKDQEHSIFRVKERVQQGGHDVPVEDILRRYERSMNNLPVAIGLADSTLIVDNSHTTHKLLFSVDKKFFIEKIYEKSIPEWLQKMLRFTSLEVGKELGFKKN